MQNIDEFVEFAFNNLVDLEKENELSGDITLISSVAFTLRRRGLDVPFEPYSDLDIEVTNKLNEKIHAINIEKSNGRTL